MGGELGRYGSDRPVEARISEPWEVRRYRPSEERLQQLARLDDGKYRKWNPYQHEFVEAMPGGERAQSDIRKFENYSMDPDNPNNKGKWKAWEQLGYNVTDPDVRRELAVRTRRFVHYMAKFAEVTDEKDHPEGTRYTIPMEIKGPPNSGKTGTLVTVWHRDHGEDAAPRLITNWLEVHKDKKGDDR